MEHRTKVRESLIALGFDRISYTDKDIRNSYSETWRKGIDEIVINWGPTLPPPKLIGNFILTPANPQSDEEKIARCEKANKHSYCCKADAGYWFCPECGVVESEDAPAHDED